MRPCEGYKMWLSVASDTMSVPEEDILNTRKRSQEVLRARNVFYWLCKLDGICLYSLSVSLGRYRTNIVKRYDKRSVIYKLAMEIYSLHNYKLNLFKDFKDVKV